MIAEISLRDPLHFVLWLTGAAIWTMVTIAVLALLCAAAWQAIVATWHVGLQALALWRGAPRNPGVTWGQAWWFSFWNRGMLR